MSIVTKTGDKGTTALMYGRRVPKNHPRVEAYGAVDELNAALGLARATAEHDLVREHLRRSLAGEPGLERLEVELHPQSGQTARAELSAVRIDYQGGPALLLNLVEMGPRAAAVPLPLRSCE